ncbi:MAG: ABC transporter permease [Sulfobacillus acidophilus]|uniref:ABC transporter permease n=1 Tax=Sulfobacillus acidophilus TaxID=53633 RepID=A0A2T2WM00_9FIRM|nr:MAG: ABC transporter permease [Sulfobacillus acidophilus]
MSSVSRSALFGITVLTIGLGLVPAVVLVSTVGVSGFVRAWHSSYQLSSALETTLLSGIIALAIIVLLGGPTVWYLARQAPPRLVTWALGLILVPLFMPPLVLGLVLAYVLGPDTAVGTILSAWGVSPTNSWFSLVVAQVYEALPYFLITAWAGLSTLSTRVEESALSLNRRPREVFWYVTVPLAAPSLIAATAMAWSRVVGAFGAVVILAYHPTGLPVAIWIGLQELGLAQALPLALWLLIVGLPIPLGFAWRGERHVALRR